MRWTHEFVGGARKDLRTIRNFIESSALSFGDAPDHARAIAKARLTAILYLAEALTLAPYQGTRCPELGASIRRVTKDKAIFYFDLIEDRQIIRILAIFYGGQDHDSRILARLLKPDQE